MIEVHWLTVSTYLKGFCFPLAMIALVTAIVARLLRTTKSALPVVLGALASLVGFVAPVCFVLVPGKGVDEELAAGARYGAIVAGVASVALICREVVRAWRRSQPRPRGFAVVVSGPARTDDVAEALRQVN
ncbi:MAG: hypothetical protein ACAI43_15285 [Phycisphaerae bacterium]|nr:hypothetical protein [Tepidisphaeraceae bacterium]